MQILPLRERADDILPLSNRLIAKHHKNPKLPVLSKDARAKLLGHSWPGNVRELDNVIQRALILRQGNSIEATDIQFENITPETGQLNGTGSEQPRSLDSEMKNHEYNKILAVLRADNGNRQSAAEKLGISQRTLRYKLARMRELGMSVPGRYGMETA